MQCVGVYLPPKASKAQRETLECLTLKEAEEGEGPQQGHQKLSGTVRIIEFWFLAIKNSTIFMMTK